MTLYKGMATFAENLEAQLKRNISRSEVYALRNVFLLNEEEKAALAQQGKKVSTLPVRNITLILSIERETNRITKETNGRRYF